MIDIYPFLLIANIVIPVYGLSIIIAVVAAWILVYFLSKMKNKASGDASLSFLIGLCGGIIGAYILRPTIKIFEVIINWEYYNTVSIGLLLSYIFGEFVFYGGLIGGFVAILLFCKSFSINTIPLLDLFAPALALAHAIGRLGCFFAGCCYGIETENSNIFSVIYPENAIGTPANIPLVAVPLIESFYLFFLSIILSVIYMKSQKNGFCFLVYLVVYSIFRFFIEFYRGDIVRGTYNYISTSQVISLTLIIFGILYYYIVRKKDKKTIILKE